MAGVYGQSVPAHMLVWNEFQSPSTHSERSRIPKARIGPTGCKWPVRSAPRPRLSTLGVTPQGPPRELIVCAKMLIC